MDKTYCVYCHTNKINGKKYIGITSQKPERRWRNEGQGYEHSPFFFKAIHKHGWENFEHEILFEGLSEEDACQKEIEYISKFETTIDKHGYNISLGGNIPSKEQCERMSKERKGVPLSQSHKDKLRDYWATHKHPMQGRYHNDETKDKIRQKTLEQIATKGHPSSGVKHSEESNFQNMLSQKTRKEVEQIDIATNKVVKIFPSQSSAARSVGTTTAAIGYACKGKYKQVCGYKWRYKQ